MYSSDWLYANEFVLGVHNCGGKKNFASGTPGVPVFLQPEVKRFLLFNSIPVIQQQHRRKKKTENINGIGEVSTHFRSNRQPIPPISS